MRIIHVKDRISAMRIVAGYIMRGRNAKINKMKKEGYEIKIYARGQK